MKLSHKARTRRGVLLLVILGLLAMFTLVAVAFVVLTSQGMRSAHIAQQIEQQCYPPWHDLDRAAMQTLRGSNNPASVLRPHSLLEDIYGNETVPGMMRHDNVNSVYVIHIAEGQLIQFPSSLTSAQSRRRVGCVLTMLEGPAKGLSTRIVDYRMIAATNGPVGCFQILAFNGASSEDVIGHFYDAGPPFQALDANANQCAYVINGTPFSGTGFGYNPASVAGLLDAREPGEDLNGNGQLDPGEDFDGDGQLDVYEDLNGNGVLDAGEDLNNNGLLDPVALRALAPNPTNPALRYIDPAGTGGANEDYDAVDYQNMLLAKILDGGNVPIPSLHRAALVQYWVKTVNSMADPSGPPVNIDPSAAATFEDLFKVLPPGLKRKIVLRPLPEDHLPNFTGSNPAYVQGTTAYETGFNPMWDGTAFDRNGDGNPDWSWDVDCDGNGRPDSVWVDLGLPVRSTSDGRQYKLLFAILCVDLDGRLNLNAHGCLAQTNPDYRPDYDPALLPNDPDNYYTFVNVTQFYEDKGSTATTTPSSAELPYFAGKNISADLPRGQGYGPADVNLRDILPPYGVTTSYPDYTWYEQLLVGNGQYPGRYGEIANVDPGAYEAGKRQAAPGELFVDDALSQNRNYEYSNSASQIGYNYWGFLPLVAANQSSYAPNACAAPTDLNAKGAVGLDPRGQPLFPYMSHSDSVDNSDLQLSETVDDPYELNLSRAAYGYVSSGQTDAPFTPAELEALLRPFDVDSGRLPGRLTTLAPGLQMNRHRDAITTESWGLPCPSVALPENVRKKLTELDYSPPVSLPDFRAHHLTDLLLAKLEIAINAANRTDAETALNDLLTGGTLRALLPLETQAGLKMNVNRPFGNGQDDNDNGVVDEPGIATRSGIAGISEVANEMVPQIDAGGNVIANIAFNHTNAVDVNGDGVVNDLDKAMARQLYARQLYVLMMMVIGDGVDGTWIQSNMVLMPNLEKIKARMVAQWAINVADFRDRDSIMTPFEYDIHPFVDDEPNDNDHNTWNVDGVIDTATDAGNATLSPPSDDQKSYRDLVWGCERPELLITETLAFHDRRTENLAGDDGKYDSNDPDGDNNYDQRIRPQGSLFIELYNPWTNLEPTPGEFQYDRDNGGLGNGSPDDLNADGKPDAGIDLAKMAGTSPMWRMVIVEPTSNNAVDMDQPNPPAIERSIYFTDPTGNTNITNDGRRYYPDPNNAPLLAPIKPGRYAVIGPGDGPGTSTTYFGVKDGTASPDDSYSDGTTRRIELTPSLDPDTSQVEVYSDGAAADLSSKEILPAVAVVINPPGIPEANPTHTMRLSVSEPVAGYPVYDPADAAITEYTPPKSTPLDEDRDVFFDGTKARYRVVYLQRLANPLAEYHPETNPYRTIDSMQIDLTAFNGVVSSGQPPNEAEPNIASLPYKFFTRERGESEEGSGQPDRKLWAQEPVVVTAPKSLNGIAAQNHCCSESFAHTLGYLNEGYQPFFVDANGEYGPDGIYKGAPQTPFPWLTWNNRPFVSQLELLMVPAASSSRLLNAQLNPFGAFNINPPSDPSPYTNMAAPFPHLMNFFYSKKDAGGDMHRLLELLHVPSRFVGTTTQGNPETFGDPANGDHNFHPPFHHISNYREPGRINLNTIYEEEVFNGLMNTSSALADWKQFRSSRRLRPGSPDPFTTATVKSHIRPGFPTRSEYPFRSYSGKYLIPPIGNSNANDLEVDATLLRRLQNNTQAPLWDSPPVIDGWNNTQRNPYFRYQGLMRLGNLVTTRSNVYVVWITVGYFEVEPNPTGVDAAHPDGYRLGQELGIETGEIKRHRAFYIFDRSIPVGFRRGHDLNAEKAILLKRFIE